MGAYGDTQGFTDGRQNECLERVKIVQFIHSSRNVDLRIIQIVPHIHTHQMLSEVLADEGNLVKWVSTKFLCSRNERKADFALVQVFFMCY